MKMAKKKNTTALQSDPNSERLINEYKQELAARQRLPKIKIENNQWVVSKIDASDDNKPIEMLSLLATFGTTSPELQVYLMREVLDAACSGGKSRPYETADLNGIIAAMQGLAPRDEIESMLASQIIATHFAVMRFLRTLKNSETILQQDSNGNIATKLMRTYIAQIEALQRYRGKGEQKVTVEHVHVHAGGQAIVGNVSRPERGRGGKKKEGTTPCKVK